MVDEVGDALLLLDDLALKFSELRMPILDVPSGMIGFGDKRKSLKRLLSF